jgi:hypothetical protein
MVLQHLRTFSQQVVDRADDIYHEVAPQMLKDFACLAAPLDMICNTATSSHCMATSHEAILLGYGTPSCSSMQAVRLLGQHLALLAAMPPAPGGSSSAPGCVGGGGPGGAPPSLLGSCLRQQNMRLVMLVGGE